MPSTSSQLNWCVEIVRCTLQIHWWNITNRFWCRLLQHFFFLFIIYLCSIQYYIYTHTHKNKLYFCYILFVFRFTQCFPRISALVRPSNKTHLRTSWMHWNSNESAIPHIDKKKDEKRETWKSRPCVWFFLSSLVFHLVRSKWIFHSKWTPIEIAFICLVQTICWFIYSMSSAGIVFYDKYCH